jgi:carboxylesterase 3/5
MDVLSILMICLLAGVSSATDCCNCVDPNTHPSATIDTGPVAGTITSLPESDVVVNKFLGIPFAKPPARFSPPEPAVSWSPNILDASQYKPSCVQNFGNNSEVREWITGWANTPPPAAGESENCLSINVWAPAFQSEELKPVLLWMFGGSFQFGTGSWETYDGTSFAANHDVLVVTYNYRTNVFGFPGAPEMADEDVNLGYVWPLRSATRRSLTSIADGLLVSSILDSL